VGLLIIAERAMGKRIAAAGAWPGRSIELAELPPAQASAEDPYGMAALAARQPSGIRALLLVAPRARPPAALLPTPVLAGLPVGLLRADLPEDLDPWLGAIAGDGADAAEGGGHGAGTEASGVVLAVFAMWKPFYLGWGERLAAALEAGYGGRGIAVRKPFADAVTREEACAELAAGPRLALYLGHGRQRGWSGYRGLRWRHVAAAPLREPVGALLALTCDNLKDGDGSLPSFGERWIDAGRAGAFFGAVDALAVPPLERIALVLEDLFAAGAARDLAGLLAATDAAVAGEADPAVGQAWRRFRLLGDPLRPL
jgi:hypothetical protein